MITEKIESNENNDQYSYTSPTHWACICEVYVRYTPKGKVISLHWGSGGVNKGFASHEIARAMAEAFTAAAERIKKLEI